MTILLVTTFIPLQQIKSGHSNVYTLKVGTPTHYMIIPFYSQEPSSSRRDADKVKPSGKQSKQSALGRLFGKRKSEGGLRWKVSDRYYKLFQLCLNFNRAMTVLGLRQTMIFEPIIRSHYYLLIYWQLLIFE